MPVAYKTCFRLVVIFKDTIVKDLVLPSPRPVTAGVHPGCDLLLPLPEGVFELVFASPSGEQGFRLATAVQRQEICTGEVHRASGQTESVSGVEAVELGPGDWLLADVAGADDLQVFCQFVRLPIAAPPPLPLRPLLRLRQTAAILASYMDQYTAAAAVLMLALLLFGRLHLPHGAHMESERISRRFSAIIRRLPTTRRIHRRSGAVKRVTRRTVIREARDISRRTARRASRSERRALTRRQVINPRLNKGALRALNRAMRRSSVVARLFRSQGGALTQVDRELAGLTSGASANGSSGDGVLDPLASQTGAGSSFGTTATGHGPRLRGPISVRSRLTSRADRRVRVARVGVGAGSVSGNGLTRAAIARVVRYRRGAIKYCYERVLRVHPELGSGKITVAFKIAPSGRVISARVVANSLSGGAAVASCVASAIRRWKFPNSDGYAVVRYPFLFSSGLK